jgi:16S rRNA (cytidine1402-2'-O)-methyltransferase
MPLIVVPTPVGNLEDMTLRGLRALREADLIACEDTRRTLKLLNAYEIKKPLLSCHAHNERDRIGPFLDRIARGERVALVSDAGTPGISDPGEALIRAVLEAGLPLEVLPGASALLPALLLSGLDAASFIFVGFLKGRASDRRKRLIALADRPETLIVYVSPHRIRADLAMIEDVLGGDRPAALVREISKIHEESLRAPLRGIREKAEAASPRGELVLVVAGCGEGPGCVLRQGVRGGSVPAETDGTTEPIWEAAAEVLRSEGGAIPEVAKAIAERYGIPKNRVRRFLLDEERRRTPVG